MADFPGRASVGYAHRSATAWQTYGRPPEILLECVLGHRRCGRKNLLLVDGHSWNGACHRGRTTALSTKAAAGVQQQDTAQLPPYRVDLPVTPLFPLHQA